MSFQSIYNHWGTDQSTLYAWFSAMHTRVDVILCHQTEEVLKSAVQEMEAELNRIEEMANYYSSRSELTEVNQQASNRAVPVSAELYQMIQACLDYNQWTLGYYDVTIKSDAHDRDTISAIELNQQASSVFFHKKGIKLDLSGFLKGYGLDKMDDILDKYDINDALINVGNSSVKAYGNHPHGVGWVVNDIPLVCECLTTSGNHAENRKHIINPHTGKYIVRRGMVSVVTENGKDGEALSTALFAANDKELQKEIADSFSETNKIYFINP